ncbi:nuclear transport factor 2 family protein [Cryobacterium adonitolivorans]|uniref:Nuclear transport factor 2 family protein n=2 Tax=Cryobacterium adonitolivorans TaxID=1259189 RepID=A0A4R8W8L6_9MICO|nr:nuclear transport factor 2 family protein [Cryobacterium adonitolivorans]
MQGYLEAWASSDADQIGALFTEDAEYFTDPFGEPWRGRAGIVAGWLEHADAPDSFTFEWSPLAITPEMSIIEGITRYTAGTVYSNLWVIRFAPNGQAREFIEWWMDQGKPSGSS